MLVMIIVKLDYLVKSLLNSRGETVLHSKMPG
jgi:hypothetical protein